MSAPRIAFVLPVFALAGGVLGAGLVADQSRWNPLVLCLLLAFALVGDVLEVEARSFTISGAFLAIGLAMVIAGPLPAMVIALITMLVDCVRRRPRPPSPPPNA